MVQTFNYQIKLENQGPNGQMVELFNRVKGLLGRSHKMAPEHRQETITEEIRKEVAWHNYFNPSCEVHHGNGASHIWISFKGGELNNERAIFISFENKYV